ncbi:MAG: CoA ester lyase [Burkholderiaceae bacterium]
MRSKLFVPGSRPDLFEKALAGPADAVSFDLEDSVRPVDKEGARAAVVRLLDSDAARRARPMMLVRVNALDSPFGHDDLVALARIGIAMINLPKVSCRDDVRAAIAVLTKAEVGSSAEPARLLVNIETPPALRRASEIAAADPRVAGLQLGLADLFEPFGIARDDVANVRSVQLAVRLAAAEAGVWAVDAAYADVDDLAGFRDEALRARRCGYVGKSCIHPKQVGIANEVFSVDLAALAFARRVVAADAAQATRGVGAFLLDGRMIDAPFIARAKQLLDQAGRDGAV